MDSILGPLVQQAGCFCGQRMYVVFWPTCVRSFCGLHVRSFCGQRMYVIFSDQRMYVVFSWPTCRLRTSNGEELSHEKFFDARDPVVLELLSGGSHRPDFNRTTAFVRHTQLETSVIFALHNLTKTKLVHLHTTHRGMRECVTERASDRASVVYCRLSQRRPQSDISECCSCSRDRSSCLLWH